MDVIRGGLKILVRFLALSTSMSSAAGPVTFTCSMPSHAPVCSLRPMRRCSSLVCPRSLPSTPSGEALTFADVAEGCRAFDETAMAIAHADGTILMAPSPSHHALLQPGDSVAVLADTYEFRAKRVS